MLERVRKFIFSEKLPLTLVNSGVILRSKKSKDKVTMNKNVRAYLRQKWIDLRQTKNKLINGPFYTLSSNTIYQWKCFCFFSDYLIGNYPRGPHVAMAQWPCTEPCHIDVLDYSAEL